MRAILVQDIIEANGKTIKQNNLEKTHNIPLGTLVEIGDGHASTGVRLFVVSHDVDCDNQYFYTLSSRKEELLTRPAFGWLADEADMAKRLEYTYQRGRLIGPLVEEDLIVVRPTQEEQAAAEADFYAKLGDYEEIRMQAVPGSKDFLAMMYSRQASYHGYKPTDILTVAYMEYNGPDENGRESYNSWHSEKYLISERALADKAFDERAATENHGINCSSFARSEDEFLEKDNAKK